MSSIAIDKKSMIVDQVGPAKVSHKCFHHWRDEEENSGALVRGRVA